MKRSHSFFAIVSLIGIGLLGVVYRCAPPSVERRQTSGKQPVEGTATPEAAQLARLRQELARLKLTVSSLEHRSAVQNPAAAPVEQPAGSEDPRRGPEARAEEEDRHREYIAGIDAAFRNETADPGWSSATSALIHAAISSDDNLKPLARAVECRSRSCRVEFADDGRGNLGSIIPMFLQRVGQALPSVAASRVENASGAATMVLYMARASDTAMLP